MTSYFFKFWKNSIFFYFLQLLCIPLKDKKKIATHVTFTVVSRSIPLTVHFLKLLEHIHQCLGLKVLSLERDLAEIGVCYRSSLNGKTWRSSAHYFLLPRSKSPRKVFRIGNAIVNSAPSYISKDAQKIVGNCF
jgi:hypothetical protein